MLADDHLGGIEVISLADEIKAGFGFAPHVIKRNSFDEQVGDQMHAAIASKGKIAQFRAGTEGRPSELDSGIDRLRPEGGHLRIEIDLCLVGGEPVFFDEIASKFCESIALGVASEGKTENDAESGITERGGIGYSEGEAQVHHLAEMPIIKVIIRIK